LGQNVGRLEKMRNCVVFKFLLNGFVKEFSLYFSYIDKSENLIIKSKFVDTKMAKHRKRDFKKSANDSAHNKPDVIWQYDSEPDLQSVTQPGRLGS
jgi:hypothetical protein